MNKKKAMDDTEIMISDVEALNKALGPAALRFLTLLHRELTDYVGISTFQYSPLADFTNAESRGRKRYAR
ncbi:MAG: hypothetical protein HYW01_13835 [Deltaproteobacteria bacterium]|nr:hypothetical protein [Deltaproteobacteria bacterium]